MFKLVNGGDRLPTRATRFSAGFDVYSREDKTIGAGCTELVGLGIALDFDAISKIICNSGFDFIEYWLDRHYFELHPRSSLRAKGLGGGVGIIDMDFVNLEIKMVITNPSNYDRFIIKLGDKIGQLILKRHEGYLLPSEYTKDEERLGGFGSTGL